MTKKLTIDIVNIVHIRTNILEGWFSTSDLCYVNLFDQPQAGQNVGNVIQASNFGWGKLAGLLITSQHIDHKMMIK